jgi:probable rRNA maturation factor
MTPTTPPEGLPGGPADGPAAGPEAGPDGATGSATVEIAAEDPAWDALDLDALATRAVTATLTALALPPEAFEVSVLACDDARIAALNAEFRAKPTPTNVLSWPAQDRAPGTPGGPPRLPDPDDPMDAELGDLALAHGVCAREAAEAGKPLADHVTHLVIHGTLHLLGHDHETDADATRMEGLEVKILQTLNMANPYETPMV